MVDHMVYIMVGQMVHDLGHPKVCHMAQHMVYPTVHHMVRQILSFHNVIHICQRFVRLSTLGPSPAAQVFGAASVKTSGRVLAN